MKVDLRLACVALTLAVLFTCICAQSREQWLSDGHKRLMDAVHHRPNVGVAKNVILFLGDGMGVTTVTAARIFKGQMEGGTGEEHQLNMDKFPYTGLVKTYNTDQQTPDSAGTATAFLSGVKTRAGTLGVDERVKLGDCTHLQEASVETIVDWAHKEGKAVGIVTTTRITHATPGAAYAKIPHRDWESDVDIKNAVGCTSDLEDIALQLVRHHHDIEVVLGGGRRAFYNNTTADPAVNGTMGRRRDGKNLIEEWEAKQASKNKRYKYVWNNEQFQRVDADSVDFLMGLFNPSHLQYEADREANGMTGEPSLSEMTKKAIEVLRKNNKGFFLLVEGGKIDHGHHKNLAHKALLDTVAMDNAIKTAMLMTSERDTLMMVTADHSHVFNIAGYPTRGNNILGKFLDTRDWARPFDGMPMTTIIYGNGPGPNRTLDLTNVTTTDKDFKFPAAVPMAYETHGGEDVAVFARGPMSHLVVGVNEQNVLPLIMGYAACIGPDKTHCTDPQASAFCTDAAPSFGAHSVFVVLLVICNLLLR